MKAFRFPLDRVLEWRRGELEEAEARFKQQSSELAAVDRERTDVEAADLRAESEVRAAPVISGEDMAALAGFREWTRKRRIALQARRAAAERVLAERQKEMMEARRRVRLIERLKQRRREEWQAAFDREVEQDAAESYLAQWGAHAKACRAS